MVLSRKNIQSVEIHWPLLVGTWKTCVAFGLRRASTPDSHVSIAGSGKSVLWFAPPPTLSTRVKLTSLFSVPRLYKISQPCAMPGGPHWPIFISTSGTFINKNFTICFPLCSSNFPLAPIPVVTYSPDSILRTIEEHEDLMIAPW